MRVRVLSTGRIVLRGVKGHPSPLKNWELPVLVIAFHWKPLFELDVLFFVVGRRHR